MNTVKKVTNQIHMEQELESIAFNTLLLLEWRLRRLEFMITGQTTPSVDIVSSNEPITNRIQRLQRSLYRLSTNSPLLRLHGQKPELFRPSAPQPELSEEQALAVVLSSAPALHATTSQLRALVEANPIIPPATSSVLWVQLKPRLEAIGDRQARIGKEVAELRRRSARTVVRWHEVEVLAAGRCWVEWEARVRRVERESARLEHSRSD